MIDCIEVRRWFKQATYTLESARVDASSGFHAWSCFKSHQAAEYALKAVLRGAGVESFGHDLMELWRKARELCDELKPLRDCIALLNKMYIPPRYPDAWAGEAVPFDNYTEKDSRESISCAKKVIEAVKACVVRECEDTEEKG